MPESMEDRYDWRAAVRARLHGAELRPEDQAAMIEEIAQHLELQFAELATRLGPAAAREQLLAQLRDDELDQAVAGKRRRATPSRASVWSSASLWRDVRQGARSLRRSPSTLLAGGAALALGIGLTATMFSIIYGMLIKGLPFDEPSRIAIVKRVDPRQPGVDAPVALGDFARYRAQQRSFETLAAYSTDIINMSGGDRPDRVQAARVTAGVFETSRVQPALGRPFGAADFERGAMPTAILADALWRDRFASSPDIIGRTLRVNGRPHTIIGVMPPHYEFPYNTRVWLPIQENLATTPVGQGESVLLVGRLRPEFAYDNANAEFAGLTQRLATLRQAADSNLRIAVLPFVRASINPRVYALLYVMLAAVFLVMLVACANVANLLLDRTANRTREIGIRAALGASRLAIVRQSVVESSLLAAVAAVAGIALAQLGIVLFNRAIVVGSPSPLFWMDVRLHPAVVGFVILIAVVASLVSGLAPAIQSARLDINTILKDESQAASSLRAGRLSRTIVVVEIAVSSAILLASGFITRSIINLRNVDPGFAMTGVLTARVTLTTGDSVRQRAFFETLERDLIARAGGNGVYLGNGLPGSGWVQHRLTVDGRIYPHERDHPVVHTLAVTPGFFSTFGVRVIRGRGIDARDRSGAEGVAVVSQSFLQRHFRNEDPIGRRIRIGSEPSAPWLTIVGVAPTLVAASFDDPWPAEVLTAFWQQRRFDTGAIAVASGTDASSAAMLRSVVSSIDPEVPVYATESMMDVMREPLRYFQIFATLFIVFGIAALVLSSIGLYAVMTFSVSRRVREMGIRLALGATAGIVVRIIMRQGARQIALGMAIGFLAGSALVRVARAVLFEVRPSDPVVMLAVAAVLGGTGLLACVVPARRATRVDPVIALRSD
jgi:putative ABC transport system permease protein